MYICHKYALSLLYIYSNFTFIIILLTFFRKTLINYANLGSNPSECQIFNLFSCVLSSLLPLRSVGRSNFDKGLHNLIMLIQKRHKIFIKVKLLYYKKESTVDSYEKKHYIYIYIVKQFLLIICRL